LWDVRVVKEIVSLNMGPHQANMVAFDPSGSVLAVASNDASIRMYQVMDGKMSALVGHEDSVQCVVFDQAGDFLVSGSSDQSIKIWS
jgi:WD40 repeat protein